MKLLVLNYEYPPVGGGGGVISRYIAEGLAALGNDITVITVWLHPLPGTEVRDNLRIIRLKSRRKNLYRSNPMEMISWSRKAKKFLSNYPGTNDFDLCLANFAIPGGMVALYLKKKFGLKYAVISHGHDIPWVLPLQMYFYHIFTWFRIRRICRESVLNFVQTPQMKKNIDRFLGERFSKKNKIISNGLDYNRFFPDYAGRCNRLKILFAGRLVAQKNPMLLLKAVKLLSDKGFDFILHILGNGPMRAKMETFVRKNGIGTFVRFFGKVPEDSMIEEYQSSHLFVVPSVSEGMSIANLEAAACGCYVMTTPVSGNPQIVENGVNGEMIASHDPEIWMEHLIRFYKEKYLLNYIVPDVFLEDFRKKFAWDHFVRQYEAALIH
ncbi:MAG: glycosyltransferase family 4 protein [Bacteroidetes bacterium]|nr:glycosyltransferase family 4 protein [Bacteroidota bacterium]